MSLQGCAERTVWREDGFGARRFENDGPAGVLEVLAVSPLLVTPAGEQAIMARAARLDTLPDGIAGRVLRIARDGGTLCVTTAVPDGVTLGDLLAALEFGTVALSDTAILELAGATVRTMAALHEVAAGAAHGALCPSHVHVARNGRVVLTAALFGESLQALQYNREQLWRTFGIALPPSATLPRFDQRADVAQLGAVVLAILLRRTLAAAEYPKAALDLIGNATERYGACAPALRMWLQQALQLHPKAMFATAADAARAYDDAVADVSGRRAGGLAVQAAVRRLCGEEQSTDVSPLAAVGLPEPAAVAEPARPAVPSRGLSLLRNVFPPLRVN